MKQMANIKETAVSCKDEHACGCCSHSQNEKEENSPAWRTYLPAIISLSLLMVGLITDHFFRSDLFNGYVRLLWYIVAYIPVGYPVVKEALTGFKRSDFFNEFTLMSVATLGAFFIGEYPEAVAVMLFYSVGELFQESAVNKARRNIKTLLDVRPDTATVLRNGKYEVVSPETVYIGDTLQIKAGEKVPLDGKLVSATGSFNTSALTGESVPRTIDNGGQVLAGMINLDRVIEIEVEKVYADSSLSRILEMVQNATSRKAKTELLIRKFARIYTPIVFFLALALTVIPYFIVSDYIFSDWLYRALVFLVISCPCALVISVPLGYFGGIGAASRNGILFKGANYLDIMAKVNTVVMDKTGTLTEGVFKVRDIVSVMPDQQHMMEYAVSLESHSNHPVAKAIVNYYDVDTKLHHPIEDVKEIAGHGMVGVVDGHKVLAGNRKLFDLYGVEYDHSVDIITETVVLISVDGKYAGYITIADAIKQDSFGAVQEMYRNGIRKTVMLSGDKSSIVRKVADELDIREAYGDLLPQDKVAHVEDLKSDKSNVIAFVGDGINDAPVLALSDVGIAMGGLGSDAAIEVADVVIQTDQPSKISTAIRIARATRSIVIQNIVFALGVKVIVLLMGAFGVATMWEAVFADVGVSMLAILNSVRILRKKF
ncbi:MAG: cadmium-translocating P-type ATPase [Tannerella sp.]|jgi:Cd2+/Zn2+-exporting ATPase|nr:cadmium-translocating P-type ATPase [Tannerella sp.]